MPTAGSTISFCSGWRGDGSERLYRPVNAWRCVGDHAVSGGRKFAVSANHHGRGAARDSTRF